MGKGKRNQQLRVEEAMGAPQKRESKNKNKKQFVWPTWAKRALAIALLVAVLAGIVLAAAMSNGTFLRGRIIVKSKTGKFDINQQMATFILWQAMYQQGYNDWINAYYQSLYTGGSSTTVDLNTYQSPDDYAMAMATFYTQSQLNTGLSLIKDYLIELVAGADAAILEAGMKYEAHDKEDAKGVVTWMRNIYIDLGYAADEHNIVPFKNFLTEVVCDGFKTSDIEDAAKVMVMYSKYSDYKSFDLQDDPTVDDLQDYILKNPAGFFESKYFSYTGADKDMMREFFTDEFMAERFEASIAKYYANKDYIDIFKLKNTDADPALTNKLTALGLNEAKKYTRTSTDGEITYSPDLGDDKVLGDYIFGTANKAGNFITVTGDKCAYLVYFKADSTATDATVAFKKYTYEACKDLIVTELEDANLGDIDAIKTALTAAIMAGENAEDKQTATEKAKELLEQMKKGTAEVDQSTVKEVDTTKPLDKNDTNTAPKVILDKLYDKNTTVYNGMTFYVDDTEMLKSYVVKVTEIKNDENNKPTTNYTIQYVELVDDPFTFLWRTFEETFNLYLIQSKVEAPTYTWEFDKFESSVVEWMLKTNFKELVLTKQANKELEKLTEAMADSGNDTLKTTLTELFGENGVQCYEDLYSVENALDSKVYNYIFNSQNKGKASVIVGKDDNVFLVYVAPDAKKETATASEGDTEHVHDHTPNTTVVEAAIKEYKYEEGSKTLTFTKDEEEVTKTYQELIKADLLADRKNTTAQKSAEDLAKEELNALKATENAKVWDPATDDAIKTIKATKPLEKNDTNTIPSAILNKLYPSGHKATKVEGTLHTFYQADDNGTSYVYKVTKVYDDLSCDVEYKAFEDSDYYYYFRAIKSKLDASLKETSSSIEYPDSITAGSYQAWLFKNEYKAAEGNTAASLTFERKKNDITFIATTDSKDASSITGITLYLVDEEVKQAYDEEKTVYAAYQLFETEEEAQKALKKLNGKTGFALLDIFTSLKHTNEVEEYTSGGHLPGYVETTSPTIGIDLTEGSVSDKNLKEWLFADDRQAYDIKVIKAEDDSGYYLALFASSDLSWKRDAKSGWVNEAFTSHLEDLISEGGYEIREKSLAKIKDLVTEAVTDK